MIGRPDTAVARIVTRVYHLSLRDLDVSTIVSDTPWRQNCYLVAHRASGSFIVVDPGVDSPELRDAIRTAGTRPVEILLTHGHPDHTGAAADLSDLLDVDCRVARADARVLRHGPVYAVAFGRRGRRTPTRIRFLDPGEQIALGQSAVSTLALPGHTPGSVGFAINGIVMTGDTLLREHLGRTDFPESDRAAIESSVDLLLDSCVREAKLLAGHGRPWTAGEARDWWTGQHATRMQGAAR